MLVRVHVPSRAEHTTNTAREKAREWTDLSEHARRWKLGTEPTTLVCSRSRYSLRDAGRRACLRAYARAERACATHERTFRWCGERCLKCPFRHNFVKRFLFPRLINPGPPRLLHLVIDRPVFPSRLVSSRLISSHLISSLCGSQKVYIWDPNRVLCLVFCMPF